MAFPSDGGLAQAWIKALALAGAVKQTATGASSTAAAGNVNYSQIERLFVQLQSAHAEFAALSTTPGLAAYAQEQLDDNALNIATEFTSMQAAITAVLDWIKTNLPKDGSGYLLVRQIDGSNAVVDRQFTPAQTAGLRTVLDALAATIA